MVLGLVYFAACAGGDAEPGTAATDSGGITNNTAATSTGAPTAGATTGMAAAVGTTGVAASTTGATTCVAPAQPCAAGCTDVTSDPANCGGCGVACTVGQACQAGVCTLSCVAPQVDCGGLCADPTSNSLHCGGCNMPCAAGEICQNSACMTGSCAEGTTLCSGACVDTLNDVAHCGGCGNSCVVGQSCQAGSCVTPDTTTTTGGVGGSTGTTTSGSTTGAGGATSTTSTTTSTTGNTVGVEESSSCPDITWPSSNGSTNLGSGIQVGSGETYDGNMQVHEGSLDNCSTGDQDSTDPLIEVANGGTVRNVIMGSNVGDGIHCLGSCTIENVWFPYVCDDAISALGNGTVNISNSGFKNARDKTIQHNGGGTVNIDNVYVETAGKLYRSCGEGCDGNSRSANISNVIAIGVDQVAGVSEDDTVTLENICVHRTFSICSVYEPGTSDESTQGVNGSNEGPNANCIFDGSDTHALLSRVGGIAFTTESVCGGPNAYKTGATATACVPGFDKCLKACMPGGYGFKEATCTGGTYAEGTGHICAMPTDSTAAQMLAQSRVETATNEVTKNADCSTEWATGIDSSNNANFCVCVKKPGYYDSSNWLAWDCQTPWW